MRALGFWGEPTDAKPRQASTDLNLVNLTHLLQAPDAARSDLRRETKRERKNGPDCLAGFRKLDDNEMALLALFQRFKQEEYFGGHAVV
jgi:hypothetical protein